jgi:hypothetical protein
MESSHCDFKRWEAICMMYIPIQSVWWAWDRDIRWVVTTGETPEEALCVLRERLASLGDDAPEWVKA